MASSPIQRSGVTDPADFRFRAAQAVAPQDAESLIASKRLTPEKHRTESLIQSKRVTPKKAVEQRQPTSTNALQRALGLQGPLESSGWAPAPIVQSWMREAQADEAYNSLSLKDKALYNAGQAMTEGPFATALEWIMKPLTVTAVGTRLLVENVLRKRPEEGGLSWGDAWDKIGGTYTFGEVLADYNVWQEPENMKWARAVGFAGDVAFDPLTWLGLIGKGLGIAGKLTQQGARTVSTHAVRSSITKGLGDDAAGVLGGVFRNSRLLDDDVTGAIVDAVTKGVDNAKVGVKHTDEGVMIDLGQAAGIRGPQIDGQYIHYLDDVLVDEIKTMMSAGERVMRRGATAATDDEIRILGKHIADNQLDAALRSPAQIGTRAVDDVFKTKNRGYKGAWLDPSEVEDLTFAFGFRVPFTGALGKKIFRHNLQQPVGIKFWGANTRVPLIGTWVRGVPQAARTVAFGRNIIGKGPVAKIAQMAGRAAQPEKLGSGYGGAIGWMKRGGRLPEVRKLLRTAFEQGDTVGVYANKALLHAAGRGDMAGRVVRQQMLRQIDAFFKEADVAGANTADLYHAIAGSEEAAVRVGQDLTDKGRELMRGLRKLANEKAGQNFLGESADYVPRILSEKGRQYLDDKGRGLVNKGHRGHAFEESGFEKTRKYISKQEYEELVDAEILKGATPQEAVANVRASGRQSDFLGEQLYRPGTEMPSGEVAQDVEQQIADIMERLGINYSLFDEDLRRSLEVYVDAISKRTGEVYVDTLMKKKGIFFDATSTYVHIPDLSSTAAVQKVRQAEQTVRRSAADLDNKLKIAVEEFGEDVARQTDAVIEAEAVLEQADAAYQRSLVEFDEATNAYHTIEMQSIEIETQIAKLEARDEAARFEMESGDLPFDRYRALEQERQEIVKQLDALYSNEIMFSHTLQRLRSTTAALLTLEDKAYSIFGNKETFEKVAAAFDSYVDGTVDDYAIAAARKGEKGFTPIHGDQVMEVPVPDGEGGVTFEQMADVVGWELRVGDRVIGSDEATEMLGNVEALVAEMDESGLASWLGLELHVRAEDADQFGSSIGQIGAITKILEGEINKAVPLLEQGLLRLGADHLVGSVPSPRNVVAAKQIMRRKIAEQWKADPSADPWVALMGDDDFRNAAATFYGTYGGERIARGVLNGTDLDELIASARVSLRQRAQDIEAQLTDAPRFEAHDASGMIYGDLTISDVVYLMRLQNGIRRGRHGPQMPFATEDIPVHKLFADGEIVDVAGPWKGQFDTAADEGSAAPIVGGTNLGFKIRYTQADGTTRYYYAKRYDRRPIGTEENPFWIVQPEEGRHRVSGEVLADRLYNDIGGGAPVSWYGATDGTTPTVGAGLWKVSEIEEDFVQGLGQVPITQQYREQLPDGTFRIVAIDDPNMVNPNVHTPMHELVGDQMATDMLVGNHDAVGFNGDNIGIDRLSGKIMRLDNGAVFHYRAQGERKTTLGYEWEGVSEFTDFFNLDFESPSGHIAGYRAFRSMLDDADNTVGFAGEMSRQVERLLAVRADNGGWENWVRKQLPKAPEEDIQMYTSWLETRTQVMAERFELPYFTGDDLIGEVLARRGIPADEIEQALREGNAGAVLKLVHGTGYNGYFIPHWGLGVPSSHWVDQTAINANVLGAVSSWVEDAGYRYGVSINLPQGSAGVKVYGLPVHQRNRYAQMVLNQSNLDPASATYLDDLSAIQDEINTLLKEGQAFADRPYQEGQRDMLFDMYERVHNTDPAFWEELLVAWRGGHALPTDTTSAPDATIQLAAKVIDTVTALDSRGIFPASMTWRDKVTFIGFLDTHAAIDLKSSLGGSSGGSTILVEEVTEQYLRGAKVMPKKGYRYPKKGVEPTTAEESANILMSSLDRLAVHPESELQADLAMFLASVSADSGNPNLAWANRSNAELSPVLKSLVGHRYNTSVDNVFGRMGQEAPKAWAVSGRSRSTFKSGKGKGITSTAKTEGWSRAGIDFETPMDVKEELSEAATRTYARFVETYRRSLSAEGYNVSVWLNPEGWDLGGMPVPHGTPAANFMLTNPRAVMPDAPAGAAVVPESVRFEGGQTTEAYKGFMHTERLLQEYEELANASFQPRRVDPEQIPDPLAARQEAKAELLTQQGVAKQRLAQAQERIDTARRAISAYEDLEDVRDSAMDAMIAAEMRLEQAQKAQAALEEIVGGAVDASDQELTDVYRDLSVALGHINLVTADQTDEAVKLLFAGRIEGMPTDELVKEWGRLFGDLPPLEDEVTRDVLSGLEGLAELSGRRPIGPEGIAGPEDQFWFPLRDWQDREEVLDELFMSGYKAFGTNSQGPEAMVEAMTAITRFNAQGGWGGFLRHYDKVHNLLKGYMIAKPGFHMRNLFSSVFMNFLHGVKFSSYRQFQRAYWQFQHDLSVEQGLTARASSMKRAMKKRGIWGNVNPDDVAIVREMYDGNILGGSSGQVAAEFLQQGARGGDFRQAWGTVNPFNARNAPLRLSRNIGVGTETYVRGVLGFDVLKNGDGTVDDAFDSITKWHFDYDDLSDFERKVVKRVIPFYTWTKHALPLMIEQVGRNPAKMSLYLKAKRNIEMGQEKAPIVPPYFIRQGAIQLPFKFKGQNMFVLPDLPFKTPMEMLDPALALDPNLSVTERIEIMLGGLGTQITPLIKAPYEWKAKQNLWKGYNFDGRYQHVPTAYRVIPLLMPTLASVGLATKQDDTWLMRDYNLHTMGQLLPTFTDLRRLFPSEERYQQRTLSTWMSFAFGLGLRTNTLEEQQRVIDSAYWQQVEEMQDMRQLSRKSQEPTGSSPLDVIPSL